MSNYKFIILFFLLVNSNVYYLYSQTVDSLSDNLYSWQLDEAFQKYYVDFDTTVNNIQEFNLIDKNSISNSVIGDLGSACRSNIFFTEKENRYTNFIFDENIEPYLLTISNQKYYFSKTPYFDLKYVMGTKQRKENDLNVLYTQNINKNWNVGFRYKLHSAKGELLRNKTSLHSYNAFFSYIGERYSMHSTFIRNKFSYDENGGISDTAFVEKDFALPRINAANSVYYKRNFFISQEYKFGTKRYELVNDTTNKEIFNELGRINYIFNVENNYRKYSEVNIVDSSFYQHMYIDSLATSDSLNLRLIENTFIWTFKEIYKKNIKFRTSFGASLENIKYTRFKGYVFIEKPEMYNSTKALSSIFGKFGNILFVINVNYYFEGYKEGNYLLNFNFNKTFVTKKQKFDVYLKTKLEKVNPFLYEQANTNNIFTWNNSFKEKINSSIRFGFNFPSISAKIELAAGSYANYIYFGNDSLPNQYEKGLNILSARVHKNFKLWKFHSNNKIIYQITDNDSIISLPKLSVYHSLYFENYLFKKAMFAQIGYELKYSTAFNALSYMPATGQFYQSNDGRRVGDYPVISAFMNMNIKNVLLFLKFEHVNGQFLKNEYAFSLNNYPVTSSIFRIGVRWQFKN